MAQVGNSQIKLCMYVEVIADSHDTKYKSMDTHENHDQTAAVLVLFIFEKNGNISK